LFLVNNQRKICNLGGTFNLHTAETYNGTTDNTPVVYNSIKRLDRESTIGAT